MILLLLLKSVNTPAADLARGLFLVLTLSVTVISTYLPMKSLSSETRKLGDEIFLFILMLNISLFFQN